ncbi:hypothetical protein SEA_ROBINROSE_34 [Microbacterium phage RobinRose]|nr:hypothetical protein SEA_ROBINROSE_34 [Microbacterium phage RobinRose]
MVTIITVYDGTISRMIKVGEVDRWAHGKAKKYERTAKAIAPKRTLRLANSHRTVQNRDARGRFETGFNVEVTAPYANFVRRGTGIYGPAGRIITLPGGKAMGPLPGSPRFIRSSRGQRPNDWLERALPSVL